ncbi:MAG: hypothetical protein AMS17_00685 [Spirochaetes bacterium DG_61]|jgi:hypothetical protein|nr:MAG: hypothetical protein AMS17_00685 [Spirochaetes bacterium DG_61]
MKKFTIPLLCFLSFATGILVSRSHAVRYSAVADEKDFLIVQAQNRTQKKDDSWVVKIDDKMITMDEFEREFHVHVYSLPLDDNQRKEYEADPANKKKFLTSLINEYLVYNKALNEGFETRQEVQDLLKAVQRRAIIQVYLNDKIESKLVDIPDEQIEAIYNQNKKMYAGVDVEVAQQQIRMLLLQRQFNDHLSELVDGLKGAAKVVRNEKLDL